MSYLSQARLEADNGFQARSRSCFIEQSGAFRSDERSDIKSLAESLLRNQPDQVSTFLRMLAGAPGFPTQVETEEGIDSSLIADLELLANVQALFPTVASLFYANDGTELTT